MLIWRKKCLCLSAPEEDVSFLDYKHCSLDSIPSDVFTHERTLEELYVDSNQIRDLPRELFLCQSLRKLCLSDNEIVHIPSVIGTLSNLEHLDISKNAIVELPEEINTCKNLKVVEASVNPLGKLPEGFTRLLGLTELYLNDAFLEVLPNSFGRLSRIKILELRENRLYTLPTSVSLMTQLQRLDLGNNDFKQMPEVITSLYSVQELWMDNNKISFVNEGIGNLVQLTFLDLSYNAIERLAADLEKCVSLTDLHLSNNQLEMLPESFGRLSSMNILKVNVNCLATLPVSIGGMVSLTELDVSGNNLEEIPSSIGLLRHLRTLYADDNFLARLPPELGSCTGLTLFSIRANNLMSIPEEIGRIPHLRVLNLSDNKIRNLPFTLTKLKELKALWLADNQTKPLIQLQSDMDPQTGMKILTCYLLPQQPRQPSDCEDDAAEYQAGAWEAGAWEAGAWEDGRDRRRMIQFDLQGPPPEHNQLQRTPTPYPKELKSRIQHIRNLAIKKAGGPIVDVDGNMSISGRRSQRQISNGCHTSNGRSTSPLATERHVLLKADKEKLLRDKAKMKRHDDDNIDKSPSRQDGSMNVSNASPNRHCGTNVGDRASRNNMPDIADHFSNLDISRPSHVYRGSNSMSNLKQDGQSRSQMEMNIDRSTNQTNAKLYFNRSGTNLNQSTENFPRNANNPNPNRCDRSAFSGEVRSPELFNIDQGGRGENCRTDDVVDQSDGIGVMSYEDFLKSVGSRGIPLLHRGRHHHSQYDHHIPRHSRHGHRHGYESDTGYRSDAVGLRSHSRRHGYESDAGYRSEAGYYSYADRYNNNRSMIESARSCYPVIEMGGMNRRPVTAGYPLREVGDRRFVGTSAHDLHSNRSQEVLSASRHSVRSSKSKRGEQLVEQDIEYDCDLPPSPPKDGIRVIPPKQRGPRRRQVQQDLRGASEGELRNVMTEMRQFRRQELEKKALLPDDSQVAMNCVELNRSRNEGNVRATTSRQQEVVATTVSHQQDPSNVSRGRRVNRANNKPFAL